MAKIAEIVDPLRSSKAIVPAQTNAWSQDSSSIPPDQVDAVEKQPRADWIDPGRSCHSIGEHVSRWDLKMLNNPAPGGKLPAEIVFG